MAQLECFQCRGEGEYGALVHLDTGTCEWRVLRCDSCDGTGIVTAAHLAAHLAAYVEGKRRRDLRVQAGLSLRELAPRMGLTPVQLSQMEWGWKDWPEGSAPVYAALEKD